MFPVYFRPRGLSHERSYKFIILANFIGKIWTSEGSLQSLSLFFAFSNIVAMHIFCWFSAPIYVRCCVYRTTLLTDWLRSVLTGVVMMIQWSINGCSYDGEGDWEPAAGVQWITMYWKSGREEALCSTSTGVCAGSRTAEQQSIYLLFFNLVVFFFSFEILEAEVKEHILFENRCSHTHFLP